MQTDGDAVQALSFPAHAGTDKIAFQGLVEGTKLTPAPYTVTLVATNAGLSSAPKSLAFTVVR